MKFYTPVLISFIACLLSFNNASAQGGSIEGSVRDADGNPIHYATVILQTPDSEFVDAAVTDSLGSYRFVSGLSAYRLIVQHLLYEQADLDSSEIESGVVILQSRENTIDDIVVRGERPLVKVTGGVLQYDVQQVTLGKVVTSAYDAVLQLPGVREQDGALVLSGAQGVTIVLNGRPTTMSPAQIIELLKKYPASYLETAEVMYSAPPQYHVRGAAINLVMRGLNAQEGAPSWQGQVDGAYTQRFYGNYSAGASLLYSSEKLSADLLYNYSNTQQREYLDLYSHHNVNGSVMDIEQHTATGREGQTHTGRLGIDYRPNGDNTVSFVYNTTILANASSDNYSIGNFSDSYVHGDSKNQLHNFAVDYSSGFGFKTGLNYTYYNSPATQYFAAIDTDGEEDSFVSDSRQKINSVLAYADQSFNLKRDWEFNFGAKFYYARDHDSQIYSDRQGGLVLTDTDNTLKEYIYDFYVGTGKNFSEQLSMNVSLTGEFYKFGEDDEWSVFPQASLTYIQSMENILQFSFSSDKRYPSYWEKQDYRSYLNGYIQLHGNPRLKSYNDYSGQLSYIRKQKYIFTLYYSYQPKYSAQLGYQSTSEYAFVYKTQNWDYNQMLGFNVIVPFKAGKWLDSRLTLNGFYQRAKADEFFDISFDNKKFIAYGRLDNTFNLSTKPDIKIELAASGMSAPIQGLIDLSEIWRIDAGVKWTFADQKAELRIRGNDVFDSWSPRISAKRSGQNFEMRSWQDSRSVAFSFTYKFGGYKGKERKQVDTSRFK